MCLLGSHINVLLNKESHIDSPPIYDRPKVGRLDCCRMDLIWDGMMVLLIMPNKN